MRTYHIRTFGCQMNKHDSERIAGLLEDELGLEPVETPEEADVVVFNTCAVREGAEERLRGHVASLKAAKRANPDLIIAVGGCIGQREGAELLAHLPHVDVVFGTNTIHRLPALLSAAAASREPAVETSETSTLFASDLPSRRETPWHAWLPITVGCDNHCTYCIVPYVRGPERSRAIEDILAEAERLIADGVVEITLLGQNVNSYCRDRYGHPRFAEVLRRVATTGVRRLRFLTSHPKDLSSETVEVMATEPTVCAYLHLPVQSGSTRVLAAMNRGYTKERYLELVESLYAAIPDIALSTDVIVGFPGETDEDFEDTLDVVRRGRFDQVFTFLYSPRPGTPAASMSDVVDPVRAQERFDRLVELVQTLALEKNERYVGTTQELLVEGTSKRDRAMLTGRTASNKIVHVPTPEGIDPTSLPGTFVTAHIVSAHTWYLSGRLEGYEPR